MNFQTLLVESQLFLTHYGLVIVFIGALLEGETVVLLAGTLCHRGTLPVGWTIVVAALGGFVGDQCWFYVGHRYGSETLLRFPWLAKQADKVAHWMKLKSDWIAVGSRFIYGTRTVAPLFLGTQKYPPLRFLLINSCSASVWAMVAVGAGYLVGAGVERLFGRFEHIEQLLLIMVVLLLLRKWYRHRKLTRNASSGP